jgi:dipeptidyl aminopeptidase/acylaminoacyl peptidase
MSEGEPSRRPMDVSDLYRIRYASEAQISADGSRLAFVRTEVAREAGCKRLQKDGFLASPRTEARWPWSEVPRCG